MAMGTLRAGSTRRGRMGRRLCASLVTGLALAVFALPGAGAAATFPYGSYTGSTFGSYDPDSALTFTPNADDGTAPVTLPFAFTIFGHAYAAGSVLRVSSNGTVQFGDNSTSFANTALPASAFPHPAILPYWTDFDTTTTYDVFPSGDGEGAASGVFGTVGDRTLAIHWWGFLHGTSPKSRISFEVDLKEGSNAIYISWYRDLTDPMANGSTATIGIQEGGASGAYQQYSYNSASVHGSSDYVAYYPQVPRNTAYPEVTGTTQVGEALTVSDGTWSPAPDTYQYRWERCTDDACGSWIDIPGATGKSYVLQTADLGHRVIGLVKGANGWGPSLDWAFSFYTETVVANSGLPHVSGAATVGATLTTTNGTWGGAPTGYDYRWYRCDTSCTTISGATGASYVLASADANRLVYAAVRARYGGVVAEWVASDNGIGPVGAAPTAPRWTVLPQLSGEPVVGATLTTTRGSWTGNPTSYTYGWVRCAAADCSTGFTPITGQTGQTYVTTATDVGFYIFSTVVATNSIGSSTGVGSAQPVGPIRSLAPVNTVAPTASGTPTVGATVTAAHGSWTASSAITYAYQWWRCMPISGGCAPSKIAGATSSSYVLAAADVGGKVYAAVIATASGQSTTVATNAIGPVSAAKPASGVAPHVTGGPVVGSTITATAGTWSGSPDAYQYKWWRCLPSGGTGCIPSLIATRTTTDTTDTYVSTSADLRGVVYVYVSAHNAGGWSAGAVSDNTIGPVVNPVPPPSPTPPSGTAGTGAVSGASVTPAPPSGQSGTPTTAPVLPSLVRRGSVKATRKGATVTVTPGLRVVCPARAACVVRVTAQTKVKGRAVTIGRATIGVAAGRTATVALRLTRRGAALLRSRHRMAIAVTVSARAGSGTAVTAHRTITVRWPARG